MTKRHKTLDSLSKSLQPEINRLNNDILSMERSKLKSQASRLLSDINSLWQGYESSYQPTMYSRTGSVRNGFSLSNVRTINEGLGPRLEIDLILDDGHMWHESLFGGQSGHAFMLISEGWEWQGGLGSYNGGMHVDRFTRFDGVGIVDTLINAYDTADMDFTFYYDGQEYGGKRDRGNHSFTR